MKNHKYTLMYAVGLVLWISETVAFGNNLKPGSPAEHFLDVVSITLMIWGIAGDLLKNITFSKPTIYQIEERSPKRERGSL